MWSPTANFGWPGPGEDSSSVLAPAFGPESMATPVNTQRPAPGMAGCGAPVRTWLTDGLPQSPNPLDSTCPACVLTAPPDALCSGIGMSTRCRLGHNTIAPRATAMPIAISSPTTILAGNGSTADGPGSMLCEWECVTRSTVEAVSWVLTGDSRRGSCPAARSRPPDRGPTAASRCAGDPVPAN